MKPEFSYKLLLKILKKFGTELYRYIYMQSQLCTCKLRFITKQYFSAII